MEHGSLTLTELNKTDSKSAGLFFRQCCTSSMWAEQMVTGRPYKDGSHLRDYADYCWGLLSESDYLEAFEGHPKIGDIESLKKKFKGSQDIARNEQSNVAKANIETLERLSIGNSEYEKKFGFIFIVFASGKSAEEMLNILEGRIDNSRTEEIATAAEEQRLIFQLRLRNLL